MPTFALYRLQDIGQEKYMTFDELVVDGGLRPMKAFRNQIQHDESLMKELESIYEKMDLHARANNIPGKFYHQLANPSRNIPEYEYKSHNIRVLCFKAHGGKIIVGAVFKEPKKKDQEQQLLNFRNIKNAYLDTLHT